MPTRWLRRWSLMAPSMYLLLLMGGSAIAGGPTAQIPVRVLTVTMAEQSLPGFLDHLRKFADANAFALRTAQTSPDATHVLAQLWREDIKAIGVNTSDANTVGTAYSIFLYRNCNDAVPDAAFDGVVAQLRDTFSQTEGVTSVSEK